MTYVLGFFAAFVASALLTPVIRRLAVRYGVVDVPAQAPDRKIHRTATPLLGGIAPISAFFFTLLVLWLLTPDVLQGLRLSVFWGLGVASLLLAVGGVLDDRYRLSPGRQILWPVLAAVTVVISGVSIAFITNPFGGLIRLDQTQLTLGRTTLLLWGGLFSFLWLMGMSYTTKFLDGLDGLVSGVTAIGGLIIFFVSVQPEVQQPTTAVLALVLSGVSVGFLLFNFHPARIFLGEAGSLWSGFMLAVLAIVSGGKIASALLLMGIPILDVVWVVLRRIREHRSPFRSADRKHLHFRLLDVGFSHRGAVLFLYALTLLFGLSTLFFHGVQKVAVLIGVVGVMVLLGFLLVRRSQRGHA